MFRSQITVASICALGLTALWQAVPANAAMTVQSIRSADEAAVMTPVRCQKQHCFTYEQYMRRGFDPKKERPAGGPGKPDAAKARERSRCIDNQRGFSNGC